MILYKLTDEHGRTYGGTQWGPGVSHSGTGEGELCGPGWIHAYTHPLLAVLLNPIHANISNPVLWRAKGRVARTDHGLKVGCLTLTTIEQMPMPQVTATQQIRFGILCAYEVYAEPAWRRWADAWLSGGNDRSASTAAEAWARSAEAAAAAAAALARSRSAEAVREAAAAAWAAAEAAQATQATEAAGMAAWAAAEAAAAKAGINLIALAEQAVADEAALAGGCAPAKPSTPSAHT